MNKLTLSRGDAPEQEGRVMLNTDVAPKEFWLCEYGDRWGFDGWELHCGNCFQVEDPTKTGTWIDVRIEFVVGAWILSGLPPRLYGEPLSNFKARRYP
jgi:hypothetical protein